MKKPNRKMFEEGIKDVDENDLLGLILPNKGQRVHP